MSLSRRDFIKVGVAGAAVTVLAGCQPNQRYVELEPYVRPPEEVLPGTATWYATTCRMCPAGCGVIVRVANGRAIKIEGSPEHPLNRGKLCARGQAGLQLLYHPDRLTAPVSQATAGSRDFVPVHWNEAVNRLARQLDAAGGRVAIWAGLSTSGHLVDLFRRYTEAVGAPAPVYYDLFAAGHSPPAPIAEADVVFSFGADFLGAGPSPVRCGVAYGQFRDQAYGKRGYLVQFEPRMSVTGAAADRWVPMAPGHEALVAGAVARIIADEGLGSEGHVQRAAERAPEVDVAAAAEACGLESGALVELARTFAEAERPVAVAGGALAAAQMLNYIAQVPAPDGAPGLDSVVKAQPSPFDDAAALIEKMEGGEIDVLLVYGANPLYDLPQGAGFANALSQVKTVVSFSPLVDETAAQAHMILPERIYLEGWGYAAPAPGMVGSQQPVVVPFYEDESTGPHYSTADVLLTAARDISGVTLPWEDEVTYLKETFEQVSGGEPAWSRILQQGGWWAPEALEMSPTEAPEAAGVEVAQAAGDAATYPYYLHLYPHALLAGTHGASLPWLQGTPDPMTTVTWQTWVEVNPQTAEALGLKDGDVVKVISPHGEIEAPAYIYPAIRPDTVAVPAGQGHIDGGRYARGRGANAVRLLGAEMGAVRVKLEKTGEQVQLALFEDKLGAQKELHL